MDVTEPYRSTEDITKTDFFDFITAPENQSTYPTFSKQMRDVNVFFEDDALNNNNQETNNNNLMLDQQIVTLESNANSGGYDNTYWNNNEKDTVKLESAILDDLNKYCNWNQHDQPEQPDEPGSPSAKTNTDGHIYTLTILNGVDQNNWYRGTSLGSLGNLGSLGPLDEPTTRDSLNIEQIAQQSLDIESILNIMPQSFNSSFDDTNQTSTDGLIKSEYAYDESNFETKEISNSLIIGNSPMLDTMDLNGSYNNNDWKVENNNTSNNANTTVNSSADSLLRSALQGKSIIRYNSLKKRDEKVVKEEVLVNTNNILFNDINNINGINNEVQLSLSENQPAQSTMEEILLSQLESGSYSHPDDFEKLKQIAHEVAESVYYQLDPVDGTGSPTNLNSMNSNLGNLNNSMYPVSEIVVPGSGLSGQTVSTTSNITSSSVLNQVSNVVTSTKPSKKYKRTQAKQTQAQTSTVTTMTATSTSGHNGIRKERSLHYCGICSKGFKDKYSVNVHIRTHTGEKPFACSLCGKSFRQKAHLAKHYQTHIAQKNAAANVGKKNHMNASNTHASNTSGKVEPSLKTNRRKGDFDKYDYKNCDSTRKMEMGELDAMDRDVSVKIKMEKMELDESSEDFYSKGSSRSTPDAIDAIMTTISTGAVIANISQTQMQPTGTVSTSSNFPKHDFLKHDTKGVQILSNNIISSSANLTTTSPTSSTGS